MNAPLRRAAAAFPLLSLLALSLSACGGDGGGTTTEPPSCVPLGLDVVPRDTAVYVDGDFALGVQTFAPCGPAVTYEVENGIATVDAATGRVSGRAYGYGRIFVRSGVLVDTVTLAVVPRARLAVANLPTSGLGAPTGVYLINADLTGRRRLTDAVSDQYGGMSPAWVPAGDALFYHSYNPATVRWNLYRVDTLGVRRQISAGEPEITEAWPTFTADGWMYYGRVDERSHEQRILRVPLAGGAPELVRTGDPAQGQGGGRPSPSPDGRRVAFQGVDASGMSDEIRFRDVQAGTDLPQRVAGSGPRFSHSGSRLAFIRDEAVFVADADGSNARQVSPAGSHYRDWVSWSPGDAWLAVYSFVPRPGIELIQASTGLVIPLSNTGDFRHPAWHPASRD